MMNKKNILITGVIIVVLFVAVSYLFNKKDDSASLVKEIKTKDSVDAKYIYNLLQKMSKVKLTDTIFSDPVFTSLTDNTISLSEQEVSRDNPFAPVGSDLTLDPTKKSTTTIKLNN